LFRADWNFSSVLAEPERHFSPSEITTFKPSENSSAPRKTHTGSVRTQATRRFRRVFICSPEWFAAIVPATPEDNTWVVLTGSPNAPAAPMVAAATTSAAAP